MVQNETFMSANEAIEKGFADELMTFEKDLGAVASLESGLLPQAVIDDFYSRKKSNAKEAQAMLFELEKEAILNGL